MTRTRLQMWPVTALLLTLLAGVAVSNFTLAAKPGGGGGETVPPPPGTIYFEQWQTGFEGTSRSMKGDGSAKADSIGGEPTYQLHGGMRWFVSSTVTAVDPDGTERLELTATAEDATVVSLGVKAIDFVWGRWAKDDTFLSFVAAFQTPEGKAAGLFVAEADWSLGAPVIGPAEKVLDVNLYDGYYPDIYYWDWSPLGDEVVYLREEQTESGDPVFSLEVLRFLADGTTETRSLLSKTWVYAPQWSPNGSRIAFEGSGSAIWTIRPDGTDALQISSPKWPSEHREPSWSPDSQHLIFTQVTRTKQKGMYLGTYTYDILRISAAGSGTTNLTGDTGDNCFGIAWR